MINKYKKENKQLTQHFNLLEFACKDGSDVILLDDSIPVKLENIRKMINTPITIVSGYRTISYNESIYGAKNSYHTKGLAVDIKSKYDIIEMALISSEFFNGIIIYKDFIHLDLRDLKYYKNKQGG